MFTEYDCTPIKWHMSSSSALSSSSPCSAHYPSPPLFSPTVSKPSICDGSSTSGVSISAPSGD